MTYTTRVTANGRTTVTGSADMLVINYSYSNTGLKTFAHQIEVSAYKGWGDALKASVDGQATMSGSCTRDSHSFPSKPLMPLNSWRAGESFFDTTATAAGAVGTCATFWYLTFTNGNYSPAVTSYTINQFRCDNDTRGRNAVGCVVPWYASALTYSKSVTPNLVRHVQLAQASGLPGADFDHPLTRTTSDWTIAANRTFACGNAPSVAGKSCDEYPIATSKNGGSGNRRSFDGCDLPDVPSGTGARGVSICMIPEAENRSQGGSNTQFFRAERVLDGDPFLVKTAN
ncbi:NucA/NucB deoxyribonuclease domain-containing protein [Streptomyces sp. NPDC003388]|uniref:NucA/NucB deoxyribonuclease domain-containing protein n=1 Tax=unclassified Streptomyces TaxID=2593676 RepID=UPI0036AD952C